MMQNLELNISKTELVKLFEEFFEEKINKKDNKKHQIYIPIKIFSNYTPPMQTLVRYLYEQKNFSYCKIARLLNRDQRTIWNNYNIVKKKFESNIQDYKRKENYKTKKENKEIAILIPISIFSDRKNSILENLVNYLICKNYSILEISELIKKSKSTIYTVYYRFKQKKKKMLTKVWTQKKLK